MFRSSAAGRNFRILARPRAGLRHEILSIEQEMGGMEQEQEQRPATNRATVRARILWPALGFPAVVTPGGQQSASAVRDGDATKCICVLVLSDRRNLSSADAARYLRYVRWDKRGRRHIDPARKEEGAFTPSELTVRTEKVDAQLTLQGRRDTFGEHVHFGANGQRQHGIVACLSGYVRNFYAKEGLPHLHEIRVSEAATARLQDGCYHLFWNNERRDESAPSEEMKLLVDRCVRPQRVPLIKSGQKDRDFLVQEYMLEYGDIHAPRKSSQHTKPTAAEILHPVFIQRHRDPALRIGHVTDTHVDVRADVYEHNIAAAKRRGDIKNGVFNNFNKSFEAVYAKAAENSDLLLITGDLIDYGRGHWGIYRANQLKDDNSYHRDRNWFYFYYLLAAGQRYTKPAYTILGNHDWRLNPYPPFSPGATKPFELLHDHAQLPAAEQKTIIQAAHGAGHALGYAYSVNAENKWQLLRQKTGDALRTFWSLIKQTSSLDVPGYPTETNIDSIVWYLFSINPFLDYAFTLPGNESVLMLDWAKTEAVLFDDVSKGEKWGYSPFSPDSAAGTPRPSGCLTPLQKQLTTDFMQGPSKAKIVGVHAPPIGPYSDWYDEDLLAGRKTYKNTLTARGPAGGHPLLANAPPGTPYGMTSDRGAVMKARDWMVEQFSNPKHSVRLVLSGHIHRNGLYVVHPPPKDIYVPKPKDIVREWRLKGALLVRGVLPGAVRGSRAPAVTLDRRPGPLYVTTTSAGPRGSFEARPLTDTEKQRGKTVEPGYARLALASDGTIQSVEFRAVDVRLPAQAPAPARTAAPGAASVRREVGETVASTW